MQIKKNKKQKKDLTTGMDVLARTIFREISLQDEFRMDILYCNNKGPLLLAWISNYMPSKVWDEITSIPKLQRCNR